MSTFAIGDIQGCYGSLAKLLDKIQFNPNKDSLWLAGDLVNRGPDNLSVLRLVKSLGDKAKVVLGNHDLHLLAASVGAKKVSKKDTIADVLKAHDSDELLHWLRHQPLLHTDQQWVMSHAGVPHIWTVKQAKALAAEVGSALRNDNYAEFLQQMYGNLPSTWHNALEGMDRLRIITNYLTRMRFLHPDGCLELQAKEGLDSAPTHTKAWFHHDRAGEDANYQFLFGHWAALEGLTYNNQFIALDTGAVWGGKLTTLNLDSGEFTQTIGL